MTLDELKLAWKAYDHKVEATQQLSEKVIISMITHRSDSRFNAAKRNYRIGFLWMAGWAAFALLICFTNPFDYQMAWQYVPVIVFVVCVVIFVVGMMNTYLQWSRISIQQATIDSALKKIIEVYERPRKFQQYTLYLFLFSQVILFPLSFLPRSIERAGFWPALGERLIPMAIAALMLYAAHRLGAFKERHKDKFREDLNELEELKAMARELKSESRDDGTVV
jgi:hypothetical protein